MKRAILICLVLLVVRNKAGLYQTGVACLSSVTAGTSRTVGSAGRNGTAAGGEYQSITADGLRGKARNHH